MCLCVCVCVRACVCVRVTHNLRQVNLDSLYSHSNLTALTYTHTTVRRLYGVTHFFLLLFTLFVRLAAIPAQCACVCVCVCAREPYLITGVAHCIELPLLRDKL